MVFKVVKVALAAFFIATFLAQSTSARSLLQVDTVGSDPRGSDVVGSDIVGSDPVGTGAAQKTATPSSPQSDSASSPSSPSAQSPSPSPTENSSTTTSETATSCTTADQVINNNPELSIFASLIKATSATTLLQDPTALFMVFAPSNSAWEAAFEGLNLTEEKLLADKELLEAVILFHIVPERALETSQWTANLALPTQADGQLLEVTTPTATTPGYYIGGTTGYALAKVQEPAIPACEALVFITDGVAVSGAVDTLLGKKGLVAG